MKFEQTVEYLPTGVMTCCIHGEETGIVDFSPSHIRLRVPERLVEKIETIELFYYQLEKKNYEFLRLTEILWPEPEEKEFWWEYCVIVKDERYQEAVSFLLKQYYEYIVLKSEACDNSFSEKLVGYPAGKDEILDEDYFSWKCRQLQEIKEKKFLTKIETLDVELAVSVENPKCYEAFLYGNTDVEHEESSRESSYGFLLKKAERLYIGNQFCHNLFPKRNVLFLLMEKAFEEQKAITLVFTYLREELLEETKNLLEEIYQWSQEKEVHLEIVVNDFGMLKMMQGKGDFFSVSYGTLLNRRRKDPRYKYKNSSPKDWKVLEENSLNVKIYYEYLKKQGVSRLEYESSGYEMKLPMLESDKRCSVKNLNKACINYRQIRGISMHLPLYQTNTSQFCTLHAICKKQDRGKQKFINACPHYCSSYVCMYPGHLEMIGKYNSLFAMDRYLLEHQELLDVYRKAGMDRIVWNLM